MTEYNFTIYGNHNDKKGNPLAKARFTRRQIFSGYADNYQQWLEHVRGIFTDSLNKKRDRFILENIACGGKKPIPDLGKKCRMELFITWGAKTHADPENVFGSIADALFTQDKNLAGSFDFDERIGESGRVEVKIFLPSSSEESGSDGYSLHPRKRVKVEKQ